MLAIVGESGTGKSTLLHILGALLIVLLKVTYTSPKFAWRACRKKMRQNSAARELGFVWQFHYLLPEFTAVENVAMPLLMRGMRRSEAEQTRPALVAGGGFSGPCQSSVRRVVRWRATAGGAGPCPDYEAQGPDGRRTHRRPRQPDSRSGFQFDRQVTSRLSSDLAHRYSQSWLCASVRPRSAPGGWQVGRGVAAVFVGLVATGVRRVGL